MQSLSTILAASTLALVMGSAVAMPSYAQATSGVVATATGPEAMIGSMVYDDEGQVVGKVDRVIAKNGTSEELVVLSVGDYVGSGSKLVAVPYSHITMKDKRAGMKTNKASMTAMAPWKPDTLKGGGG
jgi:hypothetical protein